MARLNDRQLSVVAGSETSRFLKRWGARCGGDLSAKIVYEYAFWFAKNVEYDETRNEGAVARYVHWHVARFLRAQLLPFSTKKGLKKTVLAGLDPGFRAVDSRAKEIDQKTSEKEALAFLKALCAALDRAELKRKERPERARARLSDVCDDFLACDMSRNAYAAKKGVARQRADQLLKSFVANVAPLVRARFPGLVEGAVSRPCDSRHPRRDLREPEELLEIAVARWGDSFAFSDGRVAADIYSPTLRIEGKEFLKWAMENGYLEAPKRPFQSRACSGSESAPTVYRWTPKAKAFLAERTRKKDVAAK